LHFVLAMTRAYKLSTQETHCGIDAIDTDLLSCVTGGKMRTFPYAVGFGAGAVKEWMSPTAPGPGIGDAAFRAANQAEANGNRYWGGQGLRGYAAAQRYMAGRPDCKSWSCP